MFSGVKVILAIGSSSGNTFAMSSFDFTVEGLAQLKLEVTLQ